MLQEQRKRDREAEDRLEKRKRRKQVNAAVQADVSRKEFGAYFAGNPEENDLEEYSEEEEASAEVFTSQPNLHKSVASTYNPRNFTSNSVDSSNHSEDSTSRDDVDSEEEFNQITNMLKQKNSEMFTRTPKANVEENIQISDSSDNEIAPRPPPKEKQKKPIQSPKAKGILKKPQLQKKTIKSKQSEQQPQRVKYVDFGNKYSTSYLPSDDLVTANSSKTTANAFSEAQTHERAGLGNISDGVLRLVWNILLKV